LSAAEVSGVASASVLAKLRLLDDSSRLPLAMTARGGIIEAF